MATKKNPSRGDRAAAADAVPLRQRRPGEDYWDWRARIDGPKRKHDPLVDEFLGHLRAEARAKAIFSREVTDEAAEHALFPILTRDQLKDIGRYEPLVDGALVDRDLNLIFGPSGSLKSFFLQDLGLHVAAGVPEWHGHRVRRHGTVFYVAGEGASGILQRVEAWEAERGVEPVEDFRVIPMAVNLFSTRPNQTDVLLRSMDRAGADDAALVIFDTQARCTVGANESSPGDMNIVVDNLQRIINETGAAVGIAHHSDKEGRAERGTESIRNAAGLVHRASFNRKVAVLKPEKLKEQSLEDAPTIQLHPHKVVLSEATGDKREVSSLVLRSPDPAGDALRGKVINAFQDARLADGTLTLSATVLAKKCQVRKGAALVAFRDMCAPSEPLLVAVSGGYELAEDFVNWGLE